MISPFPAHSVHGVDPEFSVATDRENIADLHGCRRSFNRCMTAGQPALPNQLYRFFSAQMCHKCRNGICPQRSDRTLYRRKSACAERQTGSSPVTLTPMRPTWHSSWSSTGATWLQTNICAILSLIKMSPMVSRSRLHAMQAPRKSRCAGGFGTR